MNRVSMIVFLIGVVLGSYLAGLIFSPANTLIIIQSIQALTITIVTIFTAWWSSRTFGFNQRVKEAKEVNSLLGEILSSGIGVCRLDQTRIIFRNPLTGVEDSEYQNRRLEEITFFNSLLSKLRRLINECATLKPLTKFRLLELSYIQLSTDGSGESSFREQIWNLQHEIMDTASFDIGIEWIKLKNKLGLKF